MVLAEIEKRFLGDASIANYFDMIAGPSTGGIIALALAHGMTAQEALRIYTQRGEYIFPHRVGVQIHTAKLRWLVKPKHDQSKMKDELLRIFRGKVLNEAQRRLVFLSFEGRHGEPFICKTPQQPDYQKESETKFAHVALHATAARPTTPGWRMMDMS